MDDQLYYVESPDGKVLGPMNMILIIEGIAEGAILETARICEVGAQEWVTLSDVTYTHEDTAPADADGIDLEAPDGAVIEEWTPRSVAPVEAGDEAEATDDAVADDAIADDRTADAEDDEPLVDTDPFGFTTAGAHDETEDDETQREAAAIQQDTAEFESPEFASSEPASSDFEDADSQVPTAIPHEDPVSEEAAFDLDMPEGDPFEAEAEPVAAEAEGAEPELVGAASGGRPKWLVPALLLLIPVVGGLYLITSGKSDAPQTARTETPAPAEVSPMEAARRALAAGNAEEAQAAFLRVLADAPENAAAQRGMGQAALLGGDAELAITHLEKAWELKNDEPMWLTDLAAALHEAGRTESALKRIGNYLEAVPTDMEWQQARLDWMLESGKKDEAAKLYRALADGNPKSAPQQYLAGVALGEGRKAETYLRRSIELDPARGDAHVALARVLAVGGDLDAARASLGRAFDLRPASPEEQSFLASLEKAKPAAKVQTAKVEAPKAEAPKAEAPKTEAPKAPPAPAAAKPRAAEPVVAAATPAPVKKAEPAPAKTDPAAAQRADLAKRAELVRAALAAADFDRADSILKKADAELGASKEAARNLGLWKGIVAFEAGRFAEALATFQALDPAASYEATGWGAGAVPNWVARVHFARGDVRSAVAALDGVGPGDANEYATARLWEGIALSSLGMTDLATRTWERIPADVGNRVGKPGQVAVMSAKYLLGSMSEKDYLNQVGPIAGYENDMHFVMAYAARRKKDDAATRQHLELSVQASTGHEFPYYLAQAEMNGSGILK